jgi:hypothetical protein
VVADQATTQWGEIRLSPLLAPATAPAAAGHASSPAPAVTAVVAGLGPVSTQPVALATVLWLAIALLTVDHVRTRRTSGGTAAAATTPANGFALQVA